MSHHEQTKEVTRQGRPIATRMLDRARRRPFAENIMRRRSAVVTLHEQAREETPDSAEEE